MVDSLIEFFTHPDWAGALPLLLRGLQMTLYVTLIGIFFGFIIGTFVGIARLSKSKIIYGLATIYIELIRGTPIIVQAIVLYFAVSQNIGINLNAPTAGIVAIAINAGAYISEIVRGGVQSIDKGQMEAGRSLGLSSRQTMRYIIWPQAFKRMIPPLGNQFIISLKDTSVFAIISLQEVTFLMRMYVSSSANTLQPYIMLCLAYLIITIPAMLILRRIERRLDVS
ncbi:amino acid ABC transporter permease [Evansella cellulosilytica]|uniref:Polar amino acid ABC transporter, inner membrane subunit n=1 Tax=Evansella cellulosilytica (strain ATCC 21833 / DSM 2522 / FERM P-1141 / JCM 9156 / N-4) TaxID=649639 RepID=E6TY49_EVAC2|nr:amino acid ABC transporter permease [Evansella cellulosilytica]ADU32368.1 polar amino acid ABC transporter, inner membrane subunit [Evansella cellulosilytica DSM 2522]